jgi:hypothetical protein
MYDFQLIALNIQYAPKIVLVSSVEDKNYVHVTNMVCNKQMKRCCKYSNFYSHTDRK